MTQDRFNEIVKQPHLADASDLEGLNKLEIKYPYFESVKILKLHIMKTTGDLDFSDYLKDVALALPDRKHVYLQLHRENVKSAVEELVHTIREQESEDASSSAEIEAKKANSEAVSEDIAHEKASGDTKTSTLPNDLDPEIESLTDQVLDEILLQPITAIYDLEKAFPPTDDTDELEEQTSGDTPEEIESPTVETSDFPILPEKRSFFDWLTPETFEDTPDSKTEENATAPSEIIDTFIKTNPRISSISEQSAAPSTDKHKIEDNNEIVTETLARIYLKQKNYSRAIKVYEQLSLKIPEKRGYFASQIHFLEKLIKKK